MSVAPGLIRDSICHFLQTTSGDASLDEITQAVQSDLGPVSASSVRSYLNLNTPDRFERTERGRYQLGAAVQASRTSSCVYSCHVVEKATIIHSDCLSWLSSQPDHSYHAVVTDPPYGLREYTPAEQDKLRGGRGGVWRIPPAFDGHQRSPVPRFTILGEEERRSIEVFFKQFGRLLHRVLVPGGNVTVASNPLLSHLVARALESAGFELRGTLVRLTMTMRGGDRPKNAHEEFDGVSVMPRSMWEPWVIARKPLEGRVQDNLRRWQTGGWRRPSADKPFGDVIRSNPTSSREKQIANHPSLKPQSFLRQLVFASLPLGEGIVLDPFAGSGSTLAACNAVGYTSVGIEKDPVYAKMAADAIGPLGAMKVVDPVQPELLDALFV